VPNVCFAGTALSWNTVKDCLHKNARRPDSPIERVGHGLYQRRLSRSTPSCCTSFSTGRLETPAR
jgi:hypothetical protein